MHLRPQSEHWVCGDRSQSSLQIWTLQYFSILLCINCSSSVRCQWCERPFSSSATNSLLDWSLGFALASPEHSPICLETISVKLSLHFLLMDLNGLEDFQWLENVCVSVPCLILFNNLFTELIVLLSLLCNCSQLYWLTSDWSFRHRCPYTTITWDTFTALRWSPFH